MAICVSTDEAVRYSLVFYLILQPCNCLRELTKYENLQITGFQKQY